jgi:two-component system cell cycle response regulator
LRGLLKPVPVDPTQIAGIRAGEGFRVDEASPGGGGVRVDPARVPPAWVLYILGGCIAIVAHSVVAQGASEPVRVARVVLYCGVSLSAAVALFAGLAWRRPRPRGPWLWLAASQVICFAADTTFFVRHVLLNLNAFPSISDPLYFVRYLPLMTAIVLFIRRRSPGRDVASLLDAAIIAVGFALLSWVFLLDPSIGPGAQDLEVLAAVLYAPLMDLAVLVLGLRLVIGAGSRTPSFYLLVSSMALNLVADCVLGLQLLAGTYHPGNFLDGLWMLAYLLLGACGLHPSMTQLSDPAAVSPQQQIGRGRMSVLAAASLTAPLMLEVQYRVHGHVSLTVNALASATLFLLVIARLNGLVRIARTAATTDALTGLYNRRFFEEQLKLETRRSARRGRPLGLLIVDVDRFKLVNDTYGHPAGDLVLREVALRLRSQVRGYDVVARYGGEEFAVLAPEVTPDVLAGLAERLRGTVADQPIVLDDGRKLLVTVSVGAAGAGLALAVPEAADPFEALVRSADQALYQAKAEGRNRYVVGGSTSPTLSPQAVTEFDRGTPARAAGPE